MGRHPKGRPRWWALQPRCSHCRQYPGELKPLDPFVTNYLNYAEVQAGRNIPMTMQNWARKLNERDILDNPDKVSLEVAKAFAESEFAK